MDARGLLESLLNSGKDLANQGVKKIEDLAKVPGEGPERQAMVSGMGKGAIAAGVLALLLGSKAGRRIGGSAVKLGSLAAIGGLAYKAFKDWQSGKSAGTPSITDPGEPVDQLSGKQADARMVTLLKAMIGAAKADGHIDAAERAGIEKQMAKLGLDTEAVQFLNEELSRPLSAADIAKGADSTEAAAEIYLTSLLVIDVDNDMERAYLDDLARALHLDPELVVKLHEQAAAVPR